MRVASKDFGGGAFNHFLFIEPRVEVKQGPQIFQRDIPPWLHRRPIGNGRGGNRPNFDLSCIVGFWAENLTRCLSLRRARKHPLKQEKPEEPAIVGEHGYHLHGVEECNFSSATANALR